LEEYRNSKTNVYTPFTPKLAKVELIDLAGVRRYFHHVSNTLQSTK